MDFSLKRLKNRSARKWVVTVDGWADEMAELDDDEREEMEEDGIAVRLTLVKVRYLSWLTIKFVFANQDNPATKTGVRGHHSLAQMVLHA